MYISPINASNGTFKGLWSRPSHVEDVHGNEYHMIRESYSVAEYYPFLDEKKDFINKEITSKHTFKENQQVIKNAGMPRYYVTEKTGLLAEKGETLAFTKAEWQKYSSGKLSEKSVIKRLVEENLKRLKLLYLIR